MQRSAPTISVIVVNFNAGAYLKRCLDSLREQSVAPHEVIIVDNGSEDGSLDALGPLPENFRIHRAGANLGFAAANNLAAGMASGDYLALLNPDTVAEPEWLKELAAAAVRFPEVAMFGSLLIDLADDTLLDGAGDVYHASGVAFRGGNGQAMPVLPDHMRVFGPCAAAALYKRAAFAAAGGFDERYFCYFEDVDLAFRLRLAGSDCIHANRSRVFHAGSGVTGRRSAFSTYHGYRNRIWTFFKDMPLPLLLLLLPLHVLAHLPMLAVTAVHGQLGPALRGIRDALAGLPGILRSRGAVRRSASVSELARALTWSPGALFNRKPYYRRAE